MSLQPRRVVAAPRARARSLAALLALAAAAHANPFASPEPPPPALPLPPGLVDQLPPLPAPDPNAPMPTPIRSPEEILADILPQLERPDYEIKPRQPEAPLPDTALTYRPRLPAPQLLQDANAYANSLAPSPATQLKSDIERQGVTLLGVILSGTPRAIIQVAGYPYIIPSGQNLPGGEARVTAINAKGVIITYLGESVELTFGDAQ